MEVLQTKKYIELKRKIKKIKNNIYISIYYMNIILSTYDWCNEGVDHKYCSKVQHNERDFLRPVWYQQRHHGVYVYFYVLYNQINFDIENTEDSILITNSDNLNFLCNNNNLNDNYYWNNNRNVYIQKQDNSWIIKTHCSDKLYVNHSDTKFPPRDGWLSSNNEYTKLPTLYSDSVKFRKYIPKNISLLEIIKNMNSNITFLKDSFIFSDSLDNVIKFLHNKFYINSIYNIPKLHYIDYNLYYNFVNNIKSDEMKIFNDDNLSNNEFLVFNGNKYYVKLGLNLENINDEEFSKTTKTIKPLFDYRDSSFLNNWNVIMNRKGNSPDQLEIIQYGIENKSIIRPLENFYNQYHYRLISIGGWCGPAEALRELSIRKESLPFDYMHSTLRGINYIIRGYHRYLNSPSNSLYPHHNLNDPKEKDSIIRRTDRFLKYLQEEKNPILFIRTIINKNYLREVNEIKDMLNLLKTKYQRYNDKVLCILHDQGIGTLKIHTEGNIMITCAEGLVGWTVQNRLEITQNYCKLIEYALDENSWNNNNLLVKHHDIKPNLVNEWDKLIWRNHDIEYGT